MILILRTTSYKGQPPSQEISAQFDTLGGSIGRAPNNQLVLPDPDKFISRLHASIVFEAGQFFIEDSSTGGTYLTNCDMLLQQGRAALHDGEKLRIGEYELLVSIPGSASTESLPNFETPPIVRQLDLAENSLLQSSILDGPFAPAKPAQPETGFFSSFIEQPESSPIHQSFTAPGIEQAPVKAEVDDLDFGDLLSKLETLPGSSSSGFSQQPDLPELPDDFFAEDLDKPDSSHPFQPATGIEPVAAETQDRTGPQAAFGLFGQTEPEPPVVQAAEPAPFFQEPAETVIEQAAPLPIRPQPGRAPQVAPVAAPVIPAQPAPAVTPQIPLAAAADAGLPANDSLVREFLAGAGIADPSFVAPEQLPALMRTSGELLRSMVEGLMLVLRARAELKSQFRVSVTTMRAVDNNPLKFTPNVDDAIKLILAPTNPGFLPPKQAVSEGFNDIMNHQIAMTAGIQAALAEILRSFDPQLIEKTQAEGVLFQKKAKCWEYYVDKYPQLKAVAQEEFFGDAFADAYEKQMLLLSRSSKKQ